MVKSCVLAYKNRPLNPTITKSYTLPSPENCTEKNVIYITFISLIFLTFLPVIRTNFFS